MFCKFNFVKEYESGERKQKEFLVEVFENQEKTILVGQSSYHVLSSNENYEQEFISSFNRKPQIQPKTYADSRREKYPSIEDQLDLMYHGGYDAWKASIDAVKTQFPKP